MSIFVVEVPAKVIVRRSWYEGVLSTQASLGSSNLFALGILSWPRLGG